MGRLMRATSLDTSFEAELRGLILLFLLGDAADADYLGALDTITVNAHTFGVGAENLNGTHRLASGELHTRTVLMTQALQHLAIQGFVTLQPDRSPAAFTITAEGESVVNHFRSRYTGQLFDTALETIERVGDLSTSELAQIIRSATPEGETR